MSFVWLYHWSPTLGLVGIAVELTYVVTVLLSLEILFDTCKLPVIVAAILLTTSTLGVPFTLKVMLAFALAMFTLLVPLLRIVSGVKFVNREPSPEK